MIENRISSYLYYERFSESNEEKCTAFQSMASFLMFIKILLKLLNCSTKSFPSGPSHCIHYFLFYKDKDTRAFPQPSVQHLVYVFPIFFRFHTCLLNAKISHK